MKVSNEHIEVALEKQGLGNVVRFLSMDFIEQAEDRFLFKCFFPEGEEPAFNQFLIHCFRNTRQSYDPVKKMYRAPIY